MAGDPTVCGLGETTHTWSAAATPTRATARANRGQNGIVAATGCSGSGASGIAGLTGRGRDDSAVDDFMATQQPDHCNRRTVSPCRKAAVRAALRGVGGITQCLPDAAATRAFLNQGKDPHTWPR